MQEKLTYTKFMGNTEYYKLWGTRVWWQEGMRKNPDKMELDVVAWENMTKRKSDYVAFEKFVKYVRKRKIQSGRDYRTLYESGHIPKSLYPKITSEYYASKRNFKKPNTKLWSFKLFYHINMFMF